ncbi:NPCBM/NEW2 domain protein [Pirellula sp. SH-Sr6A]|uniref:PVC-type heme-binding CxxCH protein n=1 Tax=Pirellula sp. SH-Sr6A TaxID=1632865 RepID=UPI00078CB4EB|nr:PVC-type heme-binding CxxCH protein [Pirellula sp. SH-Sr6A]AMV30961.1 NPCBM/NEW2 domain protein [Pirellula sp. SH-Sr6A]
MRIRIPAFVLSVVATLCIHTAGLRSAGYAQDGKKHVVFIAGRQSHDYGSHEHFAGSKILAEVVENSDSNVRCTVMRNGWPEDDRLLDQADAIVIYSDGGGGHPSLPHLPRLQKQMERGAGFVCIHYAVEVPKDRGGPEFLKWLGGYFETNWSVNPHWDAKFDTLPKHPITTGVKPFETRDEWYFHMRFPEGMKGVTPILSAVAPEHTMSRPDGPHSGNPDVRKEVAMKVPQHVAWATERPDGGRSFGFTGGHFHWNWGRTEQTKLVANAILWTAKAKIPDEGAVVAPKSVEQLKENQDETVPGGFDPKKIAESFRLTSAPVAGSDKASVAKLLFSTDTLTSKTPGHRVDAAVDIRGVKKLYLIVSSGRDGMACDWSNWVEPKLAGPSGEKSLLDLNWFTGSAEWGEPRKNANAEGGAMQVGGRIVSGIGTHAFSVIGFDLPAGYETFKAGCALDDGGVSQQNGQTTSVRFHVAAEGVPDGINDWGRNGSVQAVDRTPDKAVAGLQVADGLQASLAASEPMLKSLTNIDIDHRGRIWVCEVVNYRRHQNDRPEGDRILILEDTDHDGVVDTTKVFYQGRDIDSALGLCVLGNRILVSAAPYVLEFIDENGDDVPDRKSQILTKTGQPQHDHSVHSFVFGPDGKLYFNFGNTGQQLCDSAGNPILDRWGRKINDSGTPYRQGMVFRCNEDLSDMEVLGHNFRNNYEVAVDSFGSLWQSDNDDDGNRATRINFVMEFGNYGYVDEATGAGWQAERTNWESEIPQRHWHLNDPGVVPTMLITGAGSPTGITVYEGSLLPERYRNQVIHTDAGPNVVRAYVAQKEGAGYSATIEDIIVGEFDRWFRPADVSVAPDGSLFVSDWYDPGVGGHNMEDMERGRLFRVAPPKTPYRVPTYDFRTAEGAIEALKSPNNSARYMAFKALTGMAQQAVPSLQSMAKDPNPRYRARALWILARIQSPKQIVDQAASDTDPNVRITGIRIARQHRLPTNEFVPTLLDDSDTAVLRELCVALREDKSKEGPSYWSKLAARFDGKDRWYLEALGIAAMDRWDECIDAWLATKPDMASASSRGIVWRARGSKGAGLQIAALQSPSLPDSQISPMLRTLDFQEKSAREKGIESLLNAMKASPASERTDSLVVEGLLRTDRVANDLDPLLLASVARYVERMGDDPAQLRVLRKVRVPRLDALILERAAAWGATSQGLQALEIYATDAKNRQSLLNRLASDKPTELDLSIARIVSLGTKREWLELQRSLLESDTATKGVKAEAAIALARNKSTQPFILELAKKQAIPSEALGLVASTLRSSSEASIREEAQKLFPKAEGSQKELPSIDQLVKRRGNADRGKGIYFGAATCSQCHIVGNDGKNVGPNLSEIGSKLSKDAMYLSILAPSAGISHAYEAYALRTDEDEVITGLLVSETAQSITLKDAKGIEHTVARPNVDEFKKQDKSLMPENLHELVSDQGLVDLVEYLTTLQKAK